MKKPLFTEAAKCAPDAKTLEAITVAGFKAVELFLSKPIMARSREVVKLCRKFPLKYALHAPNDAYCPGAVRELASELKAKVVVIHDIFFDDEWMETADVFKNSGIKLCVENLVCSHEPLKFMRRFGMGRCLDLEHMQLECAGVYRSEFRSLMLQTSHVHMTGYTPGSSRWHTPADYAPENNALFLDMLTETGYSGFVVSEAGVKYQTPADFARTAAFFRQWRKNRSAA